jgi:hypothetical protein
MSAAEFSMLAASVFSVVSILQLARAVMGAPVHIGNYNVPIWASWVAFLVSGLLAAIGFAAAS